LTFKGERGETDVFRATADHPWFTVDQRWVQTSDLKLGDKIETATGEAFRLVGDVLSGRIEKTYNLEVNGLHTFLVGRDHLVVHNSCLTPIEQTLERIKNGIKFPHKNDGSIFQNREGLLPSKPAGYYTEYVHPTPGVNGPGAQRIVTGAGGEVYYTPDHYQTFTRVK
jgi:hypothetical protein